MRSSECPPIGLLGWIHGFNGLVVVGSSVTLCLLKCLTFQYSGDRTKTLLLHFCHLTKASWFSHLPPNLFLYIVPLYSCVFASASWLTESVCFFFLKDESIFVKYHQSRFLTQVEVFLIFSCYSPTTLGHWWQSWLNSWEFAL